MDMKETLKKVKRGAVSFFKRLNKKTVVAAGAVLVLGGAVLLNFILAPEGAEKEKEGLDVAIDLSDVSAAIADKEAQEGALTEGKSDAFYEMTLSRKRARDEALEVLTGVAQSNTAIDSMKQEALGELQAIAVDIESEANIESLVIAKGFDECVAVVNGDTASIIVKTDGLLDTEVAQICEIVYEQTGIHPDNLNIIESN